MQHSKEVSIIFRKNGWWQNSMKFREKKDMCWSIFLRISQISRGFKVFTQNSRLFPGFKEPKYIPGFSSVSRSNGTLFSEYLVLDSVVYLFVLQLIFICDTHLMWATMFNQSKVYVSFHATFFKYIYFLAWLSWPFVENLAAYLLQTWSMSRDTDSRLLSYLVLW